MKNYPITFWYGIPKEFVSEERIKEAIDCGMNILECRYDPETNKEFLRICSKYGVKANVYDERIGYAYNNREGWEQKLTDMVNEYKGYDSLYQYFIRDEPVDSDFPNLARVAGFLRELDPEHDAYINLLPLGAVPGGITYEQHVRGFLESVKPNILSYDHYSFLKREVEALKDLPEAILSEENRKANGWENKLFEKYNREGFFDNLEIIRKIAMEYNIPWMIIILVVEHWHYRLLNESEIRWEVFNSFAYGSSAISYFTYWTPDRKHNSEPWTYHNAIINADGSRNVNYDRIKGINGELSLMASYVIDAKSEKVFHVGYEKDTVETFNGYKGIEDIKADSLTVGFFDNGYFVAVNKDIERDQKVGFNTGKSIEFLAKDGSWNDLSGDVTIAAGDGLLLRFK